ncbi:PREDICTED: uncharacterized protein LOC109160510 [Ipomoea nil]|uniref:uncharacterized protein LOC109160510 n=1 Tax=Ipomoea nil TaxID=35883 RepID=UPI000900BE97|nr:PREDICTED: uncharacterized protein LOC109160510 [Ipomoea nil]
MPMELRSALVAGLIDQQTNTWDPHILSDLFITEDVTRISKIPVSPDYEDLWFLPNGRHSYGEKFVIFDLSTTTNLIIKRVEVSPTCQMCGLAHEDVMHALIFCEYSRLVSIVTELPITNIVTNSFPTWLVGALAALTEEQCGLMVAVLYHMWRSRNSATWKGALPRPGDVWRRAATAMHSFRQVHHRSTQPTLAAAAAIEEHEGPQCYVDAGFLQDTGEAMYGIVLLSSEGSFMAARKGKLPACFSPLMAEALALRRRYLG